MKKSALIILFVLILISSSEIIIESYSKHRYLRVSGNCILKKLGHLKAQEVFFKPLVGSIGVYTCYDHDKKIGYLFKMKASRTIYRKQIFGLGFVDYINNLMKKKKNERVNKFLDIKTKLLGGSSINVSILLNQLELDLKFLSSSNNLTPRSQIEEHERKVGTVTRDIESLLVSNKVKLQLLHEFKESLLNMFIPDDLNLISNAMGQEGDENEIQSVPVDYEFILEYNMDNTVRVYINNLRTTKLYRQINCGEYTFKRFLGLLYERYYPTPNFK